MGADAGLAAGVGRARVAVVGAREPDLGDAVGGAAIAVGDVAVVAGLSRIDDAVAAHPEARDRCKPRPRRAGAHHRLDGG
jgi:hypothetical protein